MRHWLNVAELYYVSICNKYGFSMPFNDGY